MIYEATDESILQVEEHVQRMAQEGRTQAIFRPCSCGVRQVVCVRPVDYTEWFNRRVLSHRAFPYLSKVEREIVQTGICPACWQQMVEENWEDEMVCRHAPRKAPFVVSAADYRLDCEACGILLQLCVCIGDGDPGNEPDPSCIICHGTGWTQRIPL